MLQSEAGIIIYGGTEWTMTNYTVQDKLNKAVEVYSDECRVVIDAINV